MSAQPNRMLAIPHDWRRWVFFPLLALTLLSMPPLLQESGKATVIALTAAMVVLLIAKVSLYFRSLAVVAGAVIVPWLSLVGFNWVARPVLKHIGIPLWPGLAIAGVVFAAATWGYLVVWREVPLTAVGVAVLLAVANVVGVPVLLSEHHESTVGGAAPVQTTMDVAILVPGRPASGTLSLPAGAPATGEWDVSWSVARLVDDHPEWLLLSSPDANAAEAAAHGGGATRPGAPTWRPGADRVVVLDVDGTAPGARQLSELPSVPARHGEIARWLGIGRAATPGARPIALLQTTDEARLRRWRDALERRGGTAGAIQDVGAPTLTAAAQVLAVQAAGAARALTLATRYRPVLLFDRGESPATDTPYDIDSLLRAGRVTLCHDDRTDGSRCDAKPITRSADLINGPTHLKIAPATSRTPPVTSAIYVHPTTIADGRRSLLYLDYWWYLDGNPAREGHGASCGLGLAIPGKTCFDHPADWEGMTVVVDVTAAQPVPVAIQYAEHKNVVRYDYAALRKAWDGWIGTKPRWMSDQLHDGLAQISDVSDRPLAFVAQGTHASYATACNSKDGCRQVVAKVREHRHNGGTQWFENDTADCVPDRCVQLIPTRRSGREPALWNSFKGLWGDRTCILAGAYCTFELSPGSPASQPRYRNPAHVDAWVDAGVVHRCGKGRPSCPAVPAAPRAAAISGP